MTTLPVDYLRYLASQGLSRGSIRNYAADMTRFIRWFEVASGEPFAPEKLRPVHVEQYRLSLEKEGIPTATARRYVASLKTFLKWVDPHGNIFLVPVPPPPETAPKVFSFEETSKDLLSGNKLLKAYAEYLASQGLSKSSVRNYLADMGRFIRWFEAAEVSRFSPEKILGHHVARYQTHLTRAGVPDSTIKRYVASLKQFLRWARPQVAVPQKAAV